MVWIWQVMVPNQAVFLVTRAGSEEGMLVAF